MARRNLFFAGYIGYCFLLLSAVAFGQEANKTVNGAPAREELKEEGKKSVQAGELEYVGEFLDTRVSRENYLFVQSVLAVFGNRGGLQPKTPEEQERYIWDQLLLSYEAFRRGITVEQEEIEQEVRKMLEAEKVTFDWKQDKEPYEKWVKEKTNEPVTFFENQIRHLIQLQKVNEQVMVSIEPAVSKQEAFQEFLNEHNILSVELVEFDKDEDAREFYRKAKRKPKFWEEEKAKNPKNFKRPGFVSLEFLIEIWRFPKDAAYEMMKMKAGQIYSPEPIYKGFAVFQILEPMPAVNSEFAKFKDSYYEQIRRRKKYAGLAEWFENLKKQANIKTYKKEEGK